MTSSEFASSILETISYSLKPAGFRRSGTTFSVERNDVVWIVQVQKSQKTTSELLVVTVNLGVFSRVLAARLGQHYKKPSIWECHWQQRLGFLTPAREDQWWKIRTIEEAQSIGNELSGYITTYGLPILETLSSTAELRRLWETGRSPGLTEAQRQRYLKAVNEPVGLRGH